ncbi:hypothetical protein ATEIFO6365_0011002000 [Aspergillus terreus]|uniref:Uncharacterized protein n=1 Tax=Aspergillus terreus TaxID=33178 RepID=A0A5M3Z2J4_ASPTE|nr:hypothetical protein ATETN484_0006002000 [Aspergillus terreus]GFF19761.1 hypothetical protein ATEIFO6365_0011002000 [Aspergillus terreus]
MVAERRRWTPAEDALLRHEVCLQQEQSPTGRPHRIDWNAIAMKIPGRSNKDCRKRYHNQFAGCVRKGPWSPEEDARLRALVRKYRCNWALIAQRMDTRTADLHGTTWKDIQRGYFPTRSANNIKNQFTILSRRQRGSSSSDFSTRASSPVNSSGAQSTMDAATPEQDLCIDQYLQLLPAGEAFDAHDKTICNWELTAEALDHVDQEQIGNFLHPDNLLMNPSVLCADLNPGLPSWTDEAPPIFDGEKRESSSPHVQTTTAVSDSGFSSELPDEETSRITITVEGAAPETILTVMKILFESNARVEFQRGQIDS